MIKVEGLKEVGNKLDSLAKNLEKLDGQRNVPITDLLTTSFLSMHTRFNSPDALFEESGFKVESAEDFKAIPEEKWDAYIRSISNFDSWESMLAAATQEWVQKQLVF